MPAPRVVLATRLYPPEVGAAAFRLRMLARGLVARGADVTVLTTRPPRGVAGRPATDPGVTVRRWPVRRDRQGNVRGYVQYASFDLPLALRLLLVRAPALVVAEQPPTTGAVVRLVCALRRVPYVSYCADVWADGAAAAAVRGPVVAVLRRLESWVLRGAARVLAVSDGVADAAARLGAHADRTTVVGNGVDVEVFRPDGPTADEAGDYLVYTGTLSEWQGPEVFVEALELLRARHPDLRLVMLGQGSRVEALRLLAAAMPAGAVEVRGVVPPEEAARWLRGARAALVSIVPGLGYDFARPTKIYAATACGTPVVFAGRGASRELVQRERLGWAVEHDARAVAGAVSELLEMPHRDAGRVRHLVEWTARNASLEALARDAAGAVLAEVRPRQRATGVPRAR